MADSESERDGAAPPLAAPSLAAPSLWQSRLLPFMTIAIALMGLFFFAASLVQLYSLDARTRTRPADIRESFEEFEAASPGALAQGDSALRYLGLKASVLLEQDIVSRRYQQADSIMMARVWTRYMGFLTGMILSLIGAIFVLGKLREGPTKIETEGQGLKLSLYSSSPGIILALLGTILMGFSLAVRFEISVNDVPVYFSIGIDGPSGRGGSSIPVDPGDPPSLPDPAAKPPASSSVGD